MAHEPTVKRAYAFVDGQNLFNAAKEAFGYGFPNFDVAALVREVCLSQGWVPSAIFFYTGLPDPVIDPSRHHFWTSKLTAMRIQGVHVFTRPLRYREERLVAADGSVVTAKVGREKGIDVRIALDFFRMAWRAEYDVGLIFSQDQDLAEAMELVRDLAHRTERWIFRASAFPVSPLRKNRRGVNQSQWIPIERAMYDRCIDLTDYRPPRP